MMVSVVAFFPLLLGLMVDGKSMNLVRRAKRERGIFKNEMSKKSCENRQKPSLPPIFLRPHWDHNQDQKRQKFKTLTDARREIIIS